MKRLQVQWRDHCINMSLPASGVLSATVFINDQTDRDPEAEDQMMLELGGLDCSDDLHSIWGKHPLQPGDEVTISIHDDRLSDPPLFRRGESREESEERKKAYLRQAAKELGWQLIEPED
ncbi:hypothetical protein Rhal01_02550 [Rubritalea halochordaticola]|uniref:Uncharacterized protein n=1 Tax=Rubritalea halochordaticola TaxID=714537 RepID=A0ABP9V4U8_9BACT